MHLGGVRWPGWDDDGFLQYMLPPWKAETTQRWYPQQVASHICTRTSRWKVWNLCNSKFRYQRKVWKKSGKIQKPSKVSFELTPYIYIYVRTKSIYSWQMYDKPWNQIPWSFSTPGPYVCRMSCTSTSNGWMNLVVTGAQPGEQPGKAGAALPGGGATARDPKCFLMELWRGCHFFSHDPRKINNFFASDFVASRCWPFRPKLRIVAHNLCSFFFCPASTWGLCRRFRIWSNDVPTPGCQCPIWWAVSCVAADVLFRVFHLFFQKTCPWAFLFLDHWKAELNIKSLGNFGINCQYLRKSQFLLPSCLPTSSTSPVFEVKRFITTGRQGILVVEVRLLLLVTTSY